jgi:trigger factor
LKSEIISQEGNVIVVKAEYEAGEVDGAVGKTVRELSKNANIKGFRKGHVPRSTLELFFGRKSIYRETMENLAGKALETVIEEYDLDLVTDPKLKLGDLAEGNPVEIEFTFEVRPDMELPDIASLTAERIIYEVRDEDVEEGLGQLLESHATLEPIDDDRPATPEDIIEAEYSSYETLEDGSLKELEHEKKSILYLANLRQDIAEAVIGHKPAEELNFDITLEDDYPDSRMAGRTVNYKLEILHFMKRVVPEPTDETISEISRGRYSSLDEIKSDMRKQLEENASARSDASLHESAIKALAEASVVEIPATMIDRQYLAMRREHDGMLKQDIKQSLDDYLKNNNLSVEEYDGNLKKRAEEIVRNTLVLDALAERDEISFNGDDLNEEILRDANSRRINPQEYADALSKDKQAFAAFADKVKMKNTVKHLSTLVQVIEKKEDFNPKDEYDEDDHHEDEHEGHTEETEE